MTLLLNAKMPVQTFSNIVSSVTNNVSPKKQEENDSTTIKINQWSTIAEIQKERDSAKDNRMENCVITIEAAIKAQRTRKKAETLTSHVRTPYKH